MDYYLDIRLRPDPESAPAQLMSALFTKLHRTFVTLQNQDIGISFPEHRSTRPITLGSFLRLHGSAQALERLMQPGWLSGMSDHVVLGELLPVPAGARHRIVRRVQAKSSPDRLRRRQMRRHPIDAEEALRRIPDDAAQRLDLPYVSIRSQSTEQSFRLFVEHGPTQALPQTGVFNSYGLSPVATIPWF